MNHLTIVFSGLLSVFVTASAAEELRSSIDLDVVSNSILSAIVVARVSLSEADGQCPKDRGTLRISGTLEWIRSSEDYPRPIISNGHATMQPSTDDTQQYRIETRTVERTLLFGNRFAVTGHGNLWSSRNNQMQVCRRRSAAANSVGNWSCELKKIHAFRKTG